MFFPIVFFPFRADVSVHLTASELLAYRRSYLRLNWMSAAAFGNKPHPFVSGCSVYYQETKKRETVRRPKRLAWEWSVSGCLRKACQNSAVHLCSFTCVSMSCARPSSSTRVWNPITWRHPPPFCLLVLPSLPAAQKYIIRIFGCTSAEPSIHSLTCSMSCCAVASL